MVNRASIAVGWARNALGVLAPPTEDTGGAGSSAERVRDRPLQQRPVGRQRAPQPAGRHPHLVDCVGQVPTRARIAGREVCDLFAQVPQHGVGGRRPARQKGRKPDRQPAAERASELRLLGGHDGTRRLELGADGVQQRLVPLDQLDLHLTPYRGLRRFAEHLAGDLVVGQFGQHAPVAVE